MMLWYTARGAGLAALVLLSLSTTLGALVAREAHAARAARPGLRYVAQYLHRTFAALGIAVLLVHVGTIVADSYAHVGLTGALIPFASGYRPAWVTLGVLAGYLFVLVAVLGAARGRLAGTPGGARTWRVVHCLAYLGWVSAVVHGLTSGTDSGVGWVIAIDVACITAVLTAVAVRLAGVLRTPRRVEDDRPHDRFARTSPVALPDRIGATR